MASVLVEEFNSEKNRITERKHNESDTQNENHTT